MGKPRAQGPVQMLVDKKCPKKSRCTQPCEDVPRRRENQKNRRARKQPKFAPAMPSSGHRNERDDGARGEKQADQRARQDSNRTKRGGAPIADTRIEASGPGAEKYIENPLKCQRINRFRDHVPRK